MGRLERHAARCARAVPRSARTEVRHEIRDHLVDLTRLARDRGASRREALREAVRTFGNSGRLRVDLARAARGRRTVLFAGGLRGWLASLLLYELRPFLILLVFVGLVRLLAVGVYHIPTRSMEPTLIGRAEGGDHIVVDIFTYSTLRKAGRFVPFLGDLATDIRRWDILVFRNDHAGENFIKRVAGLPGEEISVSHGDLFVNGEIARKPDRVREAMMIPLTVNGGNEPKRLLETWRTEGSWTAEGRRLVGEAEGDAAAVLAFPEPIETWYVDHEGERLGGMLDVLDLRLSADVTWRGGEGGLWLVVGQENCRVDAFLPGEGSSRPAVLVVDGEEKDRRDGVRLPKGTEIRVRAWRVDGQIRVEAAGELVLAHDLDWTLDAAEDYDSSTCEAALRLENGAIAVRAVDVARDVHYTRSGEYLSSRSYRVPDDHYFMLGDNSENSQDSRKYGPFPEGAILGRPHLVFYPGSRIRLIR
jgi:signal peptidase I